MRIFFLLTIICLSYISCQAQTVYTPLTYSVSFPVVKSTKPPVLILLHGYGSNEDNLMSFGSQVYSSFLTFSLRAPLVIRNGSFCWFPVKFLPGGVINYDYQEAIRSRALILSFISEACRVFNADSSRVYVIGFSQGAIMSFDLALFAPDKICGIAALSGRMMTETKKIQASRKLLNVKFFIAHGIKDDVVNINGSEEAVMHLKDKKANSVIYKKYEMGHTISSAELEDLRQWFKSNFKAN